MAVDGSRSLDLRSGGGERVCASGRRRAAENGGERRRPAAMRHGIELEGSVSCTLCSGK
jgi:hypothetical protein